MYAVRVEQEDGGRRTEDRGRETEDGRGPRKACVILGYGNLDDCRRRGWKRGVTEQIESFAQLRVYQAACALDYAVFVLTRDFPRDEKYALTDQIRRSSRSIGGNIAESWAKRRYPAHFVSKLTDADGELQETKHWIGRAEAYGYLPAETVLELTSRCHSIGRMLGKMIEHPAPFCR